MVRPSLVVLCGPAACGKSTFAERNFRSTQVISSDWARARVSDDERDQRFQAQAFALVHFLIEQRLTLNRLCVVDSTALTQWARKDLLELARKHQVPCIVLLFDVPLAKCLERDRARGRTVGQAVIERQYQAFEQAKASLKQEGFSQVIELRDEDLEKVQIEVVFRPVSRPAVPPQRTLPGAVRRAGPRPVPPAPARPGAVRDLRPAASARQPVPTPQPAQAATQPPAQAPTQSGAAAPAAAPAQSVPNPTPASQGSSPDDAHDQSKE